MKKKKRKICFILTSQIHYARNKLIIQELAKRNDVELQIVVGGSAVLKKYGDVETWLRNDGLTSNARVTMVVEGGSNVAMAKTAGLGLIEFTSLFENLSPELVVVRGDRYEVLPAAMAAVYMNKTVAHIEGGDMTGSIDESIRHAVTKLAHIHFATNNESAERIRKMGENPRYIFNVGSPDVEFAAVNVRSIVSADINSVGVGKRLDFTKPFLMTVQHPVTTEMGQNERNVEQTLQAISALGMPTVWFWPNIDAGTDEISHAIRKFREMSDIDAYTRFIKYLPPEKFISLLAKTACLVGNSSAGIKECSWFGTPVVNIGDREKGRMRAHNVIDVDCDRWKIQRAIKKQLKIGRHSRSYMYYKKNTSKAIAKILATCDLYVQKKFYT